MRQFLTVTLIFATLQGFAGDIQPTCIIDKKGNFFNASPSTWNMDALASQIEAALNN